MQAVSTPLHITLMFMAWQQLACACRQFVVDYLGPDFMEPSKQDLNSLLSLKRSTQLFLLIHRDEGIIFCTNVYSEVVQW